MANQGPFEIYRVSRSGESMRIAGGISSDQLAISEARREKARQPSNSYQVKDRSGAVIFQA